MGVVVVSVLGFDYGKRFIGVAVGEKYTQSARAYGSIKAHKGVPDWEAIDGLIKEWQPECFVLGLPLNMDGTEQGLTKAVRVFASNLEKRYQLKCYLVDERLSTHAAKSILGKKATKVAIDAESARIIVQQWLNEADLE